MPRTLAQSPWS